MSLDPDSDDFSAGALLDQYFGIRPIELVITWGERRYSLGSWSPYEIAVWPKQIPIMYGDDKLIDALLGSELAEDLLTRSQVALVRYRRGQSGGAARPFAEVGRHFGISASKASYKYFEAVKVARRTVEHLLNDQLPQETRDYLEKVALKIEDWEERGCPVLPWEDLR